MSETRGPASPRAATLLSLAGIALMAAAILYGFYKLDEISGEIAAKSAELAELEAQIELLEDEVERIREGPLAELITPKALAVRREGLRDSNNRQIYNYIVWLDLPHARKREIREVRYVFGDRSFLRNRLTSNEPSNGFAVGYLGWGAMTRVPITVVPLQGDDFTIDFPMARARTVVNGGGS